MSFRDFIGRVRGDSVTIGIDFGHHAVKLAQIEHRRNQMRLITANYRVYGRKILEDNEVVDMNAFTEVLQDLLQQSFPDGIRGDVVVGVNWSHGILADRLRLRKRDDVDNESFILEEAGRRSPFNEDGVNLDYEILDPDKGGSGDQEVLIVAAKGAILHAWTRRFIDAGVTPAILDVDAFAGVNAYLVSASDAELQDTVAILNIGDRRAHVSFVRNGTFHSTRVVQNASVDSFVAQMCRHLGMDQEQVSDVLQGRRQDGYNKEMFQTAMEASADEYAGAIELALRFFASTEGQERVARLYLTGGGASISGLSDFLTKRLDIQCLCLNPLRNAQALEVESGLFGSGSEVAQEFLNLMTPAIGLAMRKL